MSRQNDHEAPSEGRTISPRAVLPHNLEGSLRHLPEDDLFRLAKAVEAEMQTRGLAAMPPQNGSSAKQKVEAPIGDLTRAQISLIRSSIKAGVKPGVLSRQFGLTRAQITAALKQVP